MFFPFVFLKPDTDSTGKQAETLARSVCLPVRADNASVNANEGSYQGIAPARIAVTDA